jgi:hypothetical protein
MVYHDVPSEKTVGSVVFSTQVSPIDFFSCCASANVGITDGLQRLKPSRAACRVVVVGFKPD